MDGVVAVGFDLIVEKIEDRTVVGLAERDEILAA